MRISLLPLLIFVLTASCSQSTPNKQSMAEQSILEFEKQIIIDTALPGTSSFSALEVKALNFDVAPEGVMSAEFMAYNDQYFKNNFLRDSLYSEFETAIAKRDDAEAENYLRRIDSLEKSDSVLKERMAPYRHAYDSSRSVFGNPKYYWVETMGADGHGIRQYLLDTASLEVRYWRFQTNEVYKAY